MAETDLKRKMEDIAKDLDVSMQIIKSQMDRAQSISVPDTDETHAPDPKAAAAPALLFVTHRARRPATPCVWVFQIHHRVVGA